MIEFLAKWVAAACLLGFAWDAVRGAAPPAGRVARRRRAVGLVLAAFALLAFEVGVEESLLELACAALLAGQVRRLPRGAGRAVIAVVVAASGLAMSYFALRGLAAAARALA